ncbi:DNA-3-methyladenine glycosylase I [Demequina globuliformis]|uniref:DNA-3-methyladenine glycosylase I n=1 Tax=Demequina globuliformis TaxID=676202 RepID=UPI00078521A6|nr:DNA-3-methyladenine glycosylase I [Demequina globuliformis]
MITETNDLIRCFGAGDTLYEEYHDHEWGHEVHTEDGLFERMTLEGFQSGLSWLTILRKRDNFRDAFAGFNPEAVAAFTDEDRDRLMNDPGIVRNRRKIDAAITNARAVVALHDNGRTLDEVIWSHQPAPRDAPPADWSEVPASTAESTALAKELKALGFVFVGPTTMYALMQAVGLVDDHIAGCVARTG